MATFSSCKNFIFVKITLYWSWFGQWQFTPSSRPSSASALAAVDSWPFGRHLALSWLRGPSLPLLPWSGQLLLWTGQLLRGP
jgi:hypothetical protein